MSKIKVKATLRKVIDMSEALNKIGKEHGGIKLSIAVARNHAVLDQVVRMAREKKKFSDEYKEYRKEGSRLFEQFAKMDNSGRLLIPDEDWEKYKKECHALDTKNTQVISEQLILNKEYEAYLEKTVREFEMFPIPEEVLPENVSGNQLKSLIELIQ